MTLLLTLGLVALFSPALAGRWPAGLLVRRWLWPSLIWVALGLQFAIFRFPLPGALAPVIHVLTYAAALAFLLANRRAPGVLVAAAGAAANGITIALNGGVLPTTHWALQTAGIEVDAAFVNTGVMEHPVLPWLGDVFAVPAPLPLANTFSVGDVLIGLGIAIAAWRGSVAFGQPVQIRRPRHRAEPDRTPAPARPARHAA